MSTEPAITDHLVDLFTTRLAAVGGQVHAVPDVAAAAAAIQRIAASSDDRTIWISEQVRDRAPQLVAALTDLGFAARIPGSAAEVRDQPLGLAVAEGAIAETGTSIMSEPQVASRSVTLMTETLIVLCPAAALMPSLDEAAQVMREISAHGASYATFITGPSRTADIERQLTVGVQGPGVFHVILVGALG